MENRQSKKNVLKLSVLAYIPIGILMLLMSSSWSCISEQNVEYRNFLHNKNL